MPHKDKIKAKEYGKEYREKHKEKNKLYQLEYQKLNKDRLQQQKKDYYKAKRLDKYGILQADFDNALESQKDSCAICNVEFSDVSRIFVDHCHTTGKVRGLVCFHCNTGLGHFKDSAELLQKAKEYLENPPFKYVFLGGE